MEFLCAKCQRKHSEKRIALDYGEDMRLVSILEQIRKEIVKLVRSGGIDNKLLIQDQPDVSSQQVKRNSLSGSQFDKEKEMGSFFNFLKRERIVRFIITFDDLPEYSDPNPHSAYCSQYGENLVFRITAKRFYNLLKLSLIEYQKIMKETITFIEQPIKLELADNAGNKTDFTEVFSLIQSFSESNPEHLLFTEEINVRTAKDEYGSEFLNEFWYTHNNHPLAIQKYCSACHEPISELSGFNREYIIAVLASERVGKTAFISSMIFSLEKFPGINMVTPKHDIGWDIFNKECIVPFKAGYKPEKTLTNVRALSYSVQLGINSFSRKSQITLTFVDIPGEYMSKNGVTDEWFRQYKDLYRNVDSFWICLDVFQLSNKLPKNMPETDTGYEDEDRLLPIGSIVQNLSQINHRCLQDRKRPTAIILTKSDQFEAALNNIQGNFSLSSTERNDLFIQNATLGHYAGEKKVLDLTRMLLIEKEFFDYTKRVRNILRRVNEPLIDKIEEDFPLRAFFSLSAYGHGSIPKLPEKKKENDEGNQGNIPLLIGEERNEKNQGNVSPMPFQTLLPLLWFLALRQRIGIHFDYQKIKKKKLFRSDTYEHKTAIRLFDRDSKRMRNNLLEPIRLANGDIVFNKEIDDLENAW